MWLVPAGVVLTSGFDLRDNVRFAPFVVPSLVWSHSTFVDQTRSSIDPALHGGATLSVGWFHLGAAGERRFLDDVDGSWRVFVGVSTR